MRLFFQVQSLLSKVDNEGSKKTNLHALLSEYCPSPGGLEAPTPANTPADLSSSTRLSTLASQFRIPLAPFEEEAAYVASEEGRQCDEDEELLPLDLQLLSMFAKAPAAAAQDTKPDALDHDSLEHAQQVRNLITIGTLSRTLLHSRSCQRTIWIQKIVNNIVPSPITELCAVALVSCLCVSLRRVGSEYS